MGMLLNRVCQSFLLVPLTVVAILVGDARESTASTITFEGHGNDSALVQLQEGFTFTFLALGWGIYLDSFTPAFTQNGTTRLVASGDFDGLGSGPSANVRIQRTDASLFSLNAFDAATMFDGFTGRINVTGIFGGGGGVAASFNLNDTFSTILLPSTFVGLSSVIVTDAFIAPYNFSPGSFALDNIVYNESFAAVPEPASLLLLGTGLAGTLARRYRRKP